MASYEVELTYSAEKELAGLDKSIIPLLWQRIKGLAEEPRPRQTIKLRGAEKTYRLRFRVYRVIYNIDDEQRRITIVAIRHRKEAYR